MVFGEVVKMVDQYFKFMTTSNQLGAHLHKITNSIDDKLVAEYGKKGEPVSVDMF